MKKRGILFILLLLIFVSGCGIKRDNGEVTINVYNWGEYISNGRDGSLNVNNEFTKETGIKVNYTTFQSNEELFAKLSSGGANYDVIIPSDYMISKLIENDMLHKIDFNNVPNYNMIDEKFKYLDYDLNNEYSVPYTWGLMGIFYNKSLVDEKEEQINWDILWNEKYKGKILMFDNARDAFAIAHFILGNSINSKNENDWYNAAEKLKQQKPFVQAYVMDQIFDKMANEEAALAPYYSGDAVLMKKSNSNIGFVIPKDGTNRFVDAMCIPKSSNRKSEAEKYINFMCRTDVALANVEYTGYSTPHKEAYNQLDESVKNNEIFYPNADIINNTQVFVNLPSNINKLLDELWIQIKTGGNGNPILLLVILLTFVLLYILVLLYKRKKLR